MQNVNQGDFLYVVFTSMSNVKTFISLKTSIDDDGVVCGVTSGDILIVRHPMKMYLSFVSEGQDAKFYINTYYSTTLTDDVYVNKKACSDEGAHLGNVNDGKKKDKGSVTKSVSDGASVLDGNIKIVVQS